VYRTGYELTDAEIQAGYSRIGDLIAMPTRFYRHVAEVVAARCAPAARVLDVGCGNGLFLDQLARLRPDLELWGFDIADALVASTRARARGRWQTVQASGQQLPFADRSFDVVAMTEVVEHLKRPIDALRGAARLVRPAGQIVVTVPNVSAFSPFWRLAERCPVPLVRDVFLPSEHPRRTLQPIDTAYSYAELRQLVADSGLAVTAMHGRAFFPYVLAAVRIAQGDTGQTRFEDARRDQLPALIRLHDAVDALLDRVLPARLGYRLSLVCAPGTPA
jgi:2-polyprenyl-3-methyl-5-hydroxy-6-metoxy-1,4-benzoquinol methylase